MVDMWPHTPHALTVAGVLSSYRSVCQVLLDLVKAALHIANFHLQLAICLLQLCHSLLQLGIGSSQVLQLLRCSSMVAIAIGLNGGQLCFEPCLISSCLHNAQQEQS